MVKVIESDCIGCGLCASIADDVFEMKDTDEGSKAKVKTQKKDEAVKDAIESCPVNAIKE